MVVEAMRSVGKPYLREVVQTISVPRHRDAEAGANRFVAGWINEQLISFGYASALVGEHENVIARGASEADKTILIGAHYDSVPKTPGADDNASGVAAMLGCAKAVAEFAPGVPICFAAFNREEDGFIGSRDFVTHYGRGVSVAHILEMVGYSDDRPGTQKKPPGLPINVPDTGNFLGLMGNRDSLERVDDLLQTSKTYMPDLPVIGLKLQFGIEQFIPDLGRSDHVPFWQQRIPAIMWTDTADFRNPNYHRTTDTPDTLNYKFLLQVTQLLIAMVLARS